MSNRWSRRAPDTGRPSDGPVRALGSLDPGVDDVGYWNRFEGWVLAAAGPELARRRLIADVTVGHVLTSWARTLVPTALVAAALAGLLLMSDSRAPAPLPLSVEEMLVADLGEEPIPAVAFVAESF